MTRLVSPRLETRIALGRCRTTKKIGNVFGAFVGISLLFAAPAAASELPDARDLIVRSLEAGEKNEELLRSYISRTRSSFKQLDHDGSLKSDEIKTFDYVELDGFHVRRLIAKNDRPLPAAEAQKEDSRVAKLVSQRQHETPQARERRLTEAKEKRVKERRFSQELPDAFDYRLAGEETIAGRKVWAIDAAPHPGYKPKDLKAQVFPHVRGRIWIDQTDLLWVKSEATAFESFAIAFSAAAKLDQGAHLSFEQIRLPDGVWVTSRVGIRAKARIALVKHLSFDMQMSSTEFRKVAPETRLQDSKDDI